MNSNAAFREEETRSYRIGRGMALYGVGFSLVWFGGIVGFIIFPIFRDFPHRWGSASEAGAVLVVLLIALAPGLQMTLMPYEVALGDDGNCKFRSVLRRRHVRVHQIKRITSDEDDVYIHHDHGKVHMSGSGDFEEFLLRVVKLNPGIKVEGWLRKEALRDAAS
jgi:hypothetical protein